MDLSEQYYNKMYDYKYGIKYLELYLDSTVRAQRRWKIILAVSSCSAIAAWTAWTNLAYWWGLIIVASEIATVVIDHLSYDYTKEELFRSLVLKTPIVSDMEHDWNEIKIQKKDDTHINELMYKYVKKWDSTESKLFSQNSLKQNKRIMKRAQEETEQYFVDMFGGKNEQ